MSFFGDLVNSIGGEKAPAPPIRPQQKSISTNLAATNGSKSAPPTPSAESSTRPVYKGTAGTIASQQGSNLKRKAEELSTERPVKLPKPIMQSISDRDGQKPSKLNDSATISPTTTNPANGISSVQSASTVVRPPAKAPAKGSYAEIMARAKEARQTKPAPQIGVIKHQAKEKIKVSKLAERRKEDQDKDRNKSAIIAQSGKLGLSGKADPRRRSVSPIKKGELSRPKQPQAPKPPLHGPPKPQNAVPSYKGTMGQAPRKSRDEVRQKKSSRFDEYLATDEEDEGDYGEDDGYGDGYSDASSDMEAGFDDVDREERLGLKAAINDDKRELELEARLKNEKKAKLAALAQKQRR